MKTYLVTGGAGFIGSNFVLYMLGRCDDIRIVNVDALTYAGNLENLRAIEGDARHIFVRADIRDTERISALMEEHDPRRSSARTLRCAPTAPIRPARRRPTSSPWPITTPSACPCW